MTGISDLDYILSRVEAARGYDDYIPTAEESEYNSPEKEKFNRVLDDIERTVKFHQEKSESNNEQNQ